jgi:hypothetical protein
VSDQPQIRNIKRINPVQLFLWIALVLALLGSLRHVAHTFASIDGDWGWGLMQAVAVDVGLLALALAIMQRRRSALSAGGVIAGVVVFTVISVYANLAYGLTFKNNGVAPQWIEDAKPWILAATLPVLVLYLAEIVGSQWTKKSATPATQAATPDNTYDRRMAIVAALNETPDITQTQLAKDVNTTRTTVSKDLKWLRAEGYIKRNGNGWVVKEVTH